ncbi:Physarolisin [Diplonema papillatum]|nr:Physarolisin [Diplonema papillatum]
MMAKTGMLLMAAACAALSIPHEKVKGPEGFGWTKHERIPRDELLGFTIALKHTDAQKAWLKETIDAVSDLHNARYGQYLSMQDIAEKMGAAKEKSDAVLTAFTGAGFTGVELLPARDFARAYATHAVAAEFFKTEFCRWESSRNVSITRACSPFYHLPQNIAGAIDIVGGLINFPLATHGAKMAVRANAGAGNYIDTLRHTYNMVDVRPLTKQSTTCFAQFADQWYSPDDLQDFFRHESPSQVGQVIAKKIGPWHPGDGFEANLDSQYLAAMGNGVETWVWSNPKLVNNQVPWLEFFSNLSSITEAPLVMSISYGEGAHTLTRDYVERSNVELQKIGLRGITVVVASGDRGANCQDDKFTPEFPSYLPYLVTVGGTSSCTPGSSVGFFSGGGFADWYPRPKWQETVVNEYLKKTTVNTTLFNAAGRGYPDVSACGEVDICLNSDCERRLVGTSCSTPIFSAIIGLFNDMRFYSGRPPLGFVTPALYAAYARNVGAFNDITAGETTGCPACNAAFEATTGWDPTSGLGTPNYWLLLAELMAFPAA